MLVYGDRTHRQETREKLQLLEDTLQALATKQPGIERHGELVAAFIEAGELAQAIADAEFSVRQCDARSRTVDAAMQIVITLAQAVGTSWTSAFRTMTPLHSNSVVQLRSAPLPDVIECKQAEGYAFYALYPEAYFRAASMLPSGPQTRVIGIRSIGTGLAGLVAAAAKAPLPMTVRPTGHPFRRTLSLAPELARDILADPQACFAIVDEGPGLSGSSFGAVADFLESNGVARWRLHFLPSHRGDLGPQASEAHQLRWTEAHRHIVDFDELILRAELPALRLENWMSDLVGLSAAPMEDISGGSWRRLRYDGKEAWPPAAIHQERRKYLLQTTEGRWLLKFAGLGRDGHRKLDRARRLHAAGFTPEVRGLRHGFLVERWVEEAQPLDLAAFDRGRLVETIGRYLGYRAKHFPAEHGRGASLSALVEMASHNVQEALGERAREAVGRRLPQLSRIEQAVRPVETDSRMHRWEWLVLPDGRLLKTDAIDHHAAHDLIGCQDVAWDIAGACVELSLSGREARGLRAIVQREAGYEVSPELIEFMQICYPAFQLGYYTMAAQVQNGAEARRLAAAAGRYAALLRGALAGA